MNKTMSNLFLQVPRVRSTLESLSEKHVKTAQGLHGLSLHQGNRGQAREKPKKAIGAHLREIIGKRKNSKVQFLA